MVERSLGAEAIADWIEVEALTGSTPGRSIDEFTQVAVDQLGITTDRAHGALNLIGRRSRVLGDQYPIDVRKVGLIRKPNPLAFPYVGLLLISPSLPSRSLSDKQLEIAAIALEDAAAEALANFLGEGGKAIRFAWPSSVGRPEQFAHAITWLVEQMGATLGDAYRQPRRKDGGVDVVAWRPFPDQRSGFPVILAQATIGTDYVNKSADIDLRLWSGWLSLDVDPTIALVMPGTLPNGEEWNEMAARSLIFERVRLAGLLPVGIESPSLRSLRDLAAEIMGIPTFGSGE